MPVFLGTGVNTSCVSPHLVFITAQEGGLVMHHQIDTRVQDLEGCRVFSNQAVLSPKYTCEDGDHPLGPKPGVAPAWALHSSPPQGPPW